MIIGHGFLANGPLNVFIYAYRLVLLLIPQGLITGKSIENNWLLKADPKWSIGITSANARNIAEGADRINELEEGVDYCEHSPQ